MGLVLDENPTEAQVRACKQEEAKALAEFDRAGGVGLFGEHNRPPGFQGGIPYQNEGLRTYRKRLAAWRSSLRMAYCRLARPGRRS